MLENIQNGKALAKFKELVQNQDGDISYIEDTSKFEKAQYILPVMLDKRIEETTKQEVTVKRLKAEEIGKLSVYLGGGRIQKEDKIDQAVGIVLNKKVGDKVKKRRDSSIYTCKLQGKRRRSGKKIKRDICSRIG